MLDAMLGDRHHGELRSYWGMGVPKAGDCEVVSWFLVPGTGLEPVRSCLRGIFLLTTAFAAEPKRLIWSLDFLFTVSAAMPRRI